MAIGSADQLAAGAAARVAGGWLMVSASATAAYAFLLALLVVIIYFEDHSILAPLVILSGVGLLVAAVIAAMRRRWMAWLAAAYALIALAGDGPHQIPEILHPQSVTHTAGAVILIVAGVAAMAIAVRAGVRR